MKLPTRLRYGMRFMANLAAHYETGDVVSISKISEEEDISNKYLEQIISSFVKADLIKGVRGKGGGYRLVKEPSTVTVYDIATALGEDFTFIKCTFDPNYCGRQSKCATKDLWKEYSDLSRDLFKRYTLDTIVDRA